MKYLPFLILLIPMSATAGGYKYINLNDTSSLNYNFERIKTEFLDTTHQSSTETVTGLKTFSKGVRFSDGTIQTTAASGSGGSGIVSPGTFTWTNNFGITASTFTGTLLKTSTVQIVNVGTAAEAQIQWIIPALLPNLYGFGWVSGQNSLGVYNAGTLDEVFRSPGIRSNNGGAANQVAYGIQSANTGLYGPDNTEADIAAVGVQKAKFTASQNTFYLTNFFESNATVRAGTSISSSTMGGSLYQNTTSTSNAAAAETTFYMNTITANTLGTNGDSLSFDAAGSFAGTVAVDKRIRIRFGGTALFDTGNLAVTSASSWVLSGTCIRIGSTDCKCMVMLNTSFASLAAYANYTTVTKTLSSNNTLSITGSGTNAADVSGEMYKIRWDPAGVNAP